jgi:hypothetical protein
MRSSTNYFILLLIAVLSFSNCKKEETDKTETDSEVQKETTLYFTGTIDGQTISYTAGQNNMTNTVDSRDYYNYNSTYTAHGEFSKLASLDNTKLLRIIFVKGHLLPIDCEDKLSILGLRTFRYTRFINSNSTLEGIVVSYRYAGKDWTTDSSPFTQTGNSLSIIKLDDIINSGNVVGKILKANFNCTLYDNSGNKIELTNGIIRMKFGDC